MSYVMSDQLRPYKKEQEEQPTIHVTLLDAGICHYSQPVVCSTSSYLYVRAFVCLWSGEWVLASSE